MWLRSRFAFVLRYSLDEFVLGVNDQWTDQLSVAASIAITRTMMCGCNNGNVQVSSDAVTLRCYRYCSAANAAAIGAIYCDSSLCRHGTGNLRIQCKANQLELLTSI